MQEYRSVDELRSSYVILYYNFFSYVETLHKQEVIKKPLLFVYTQQSMFLIETELMIQTHHLLHSILSLRDNRTLVALIRLTHKTPTD